MFEKLTSQVSKIVAFAVLISSCLVCLRGQAATMTLSADRDASILSTSCCGLSPGSNHGASAVIQAGTAGGAGLEVRSLISFDASPLAGQYSSIESIKLRLHSEASSDLSGVGSFAIEVHEISAANGDWVEGTGGTDESSWANKDNNGGVSPTPWASGLGGLPTAGTDYNPTILANNPFASAPAANTIVDFDFTGTNAALTNLIDGWLTFNPGLLLFSTPVPTGDNKRIRFHSNQEITSGTGAYVPQLIVTFAPPVPEPSSFLLLGIGVLGMLRHTRRSRRSA